MKGLSSTANTDTRAKDSHYHYPELNALKQLLYTRCDQAFHAATESSLSGLKAHALAASARTVASKLDLLTLDLLGVLHNIVNAT